MAGANVRGVRLCNGVSQTPRDRFVWRRQRLERLSSVVQSESSDQEEGEAELMWAAAVN